LSQFLPSLSEGDSLRRKVENMNLLKVRETCLGDSLREVKPRLLARGGWDSLPHPSSLSPA